MYKAFHMGTSVSEEPTASYFQNSPRISDQTTRRRRTPDLKHHMKLRKWAFVWIFVRHYTSSRNTLHVALLCHKSSTVHRDGCNCQLTVADICTK